MFNERKWNKYIYEASFSLEDKKSEENLQEFTEPVVHEARIILSVSGERNITDILQDIRAIEGITIVDIEETRQFLGRKKTVIKLKYLVSGKLPAEYKEFLRRALPGVVGVNAARIVFSRPAKK
tara:strand:- start:460 stop:831 length:372 start_codon:yes stop_codon:yes gene_type:complete